MGLVILTVITLGAMVAMQRSTVQLKMVSNLQHKQELNSAAMSTTSYFYTTMENNTALQNLLLIEAETRYRDSLTPDPVSGTAPDPSFQPFKVFPQQFVQPQFKAKSISAAGPVASMQYLPSPPGNNFYLKGKGGCGSGCSSLHAAINVSVTSKNNLLTARQEIGVRRLTPGGVNQ